MDYNTHVNELCGVFVHVCCWHLWMGHTSGGGACDVGDER